MAHRQQPRTSAALALAALLAVAAGFACSGAAAEVQAGLRAGAHEEPARKPPVVSPAPAPRVDPRHAQRAAALTERFRARITHWIGEANRLSKGKASAKNVRVAACVRALGAREDLVSLRADAPQPPASNMKLVTTAAALILLGREAQWVTPCEASAPLRDGALAGDLVLHAAGDPLWDARGHGEVEGRLAECARALAAAGLRRIQGDLVLDEGSFETPGPGPSWPDPSQHWAEYCALSGGFNANGGILHALVRAGAVGASAALAVHPSPHGLKTSYDVRTTVGTKVDVRVGATASTATVRGTLGKDIGEYEAEFAHPDPVGLFGALFADALHGAGIELAGSVRRARNTARGVVLAELRSPLAGCLEAINADSRNGVADQVFLSLGQAVAGAGTRAGGARAVALALERLGLADEPVHQVDGSGLSREDRVTARAITALLERVLGAEPATAQLYRDSLAVMGQKGTLEERLRGSVAEGRVHAKTGWIAGVSCLSGYVEPPPESGAPPAVFSILIEYPSELGGLNASCFKNLQDELVLLLFRDGA
ncbi:MAG: D-alanyl-D-alanine carboxypeptidase/D-alanyl-D-alanine-endopeptidase [Planctomycetes bacterium]|nr:D-alanyl-D-alanine carboxypeptidase/D-alanyl-D-alanine-endopeptidase [Planctomycetota bacterium]